MKPLSLALASLVFASPSLAASRIWPDPGATCRPALVRLAPGEENATVVFSTPRKFDFPTTLSIANAAVDSPNAAIVRFKLTSGVWQHCVYALEPEHRKTYQRTECTTPNVTGLELQLAQVEAVMPAGESTLHVALREPPPCASTPRSYDNLTVTQGGKFFPKDNPESSRWVAVLDELLISEEQIEQVANELAAQYGVTLLRLTHGPYGFSFEGSYSKAKGLAFNKWIRFVESDVDYFGYGYVDSKLLLQGTPNSWALDRLDQREALRDPNAFADSTAEDHRYRFPEATRPLAARPRVFVVDNRALANHITFSGFPVTSVNVNGAPPQCPSSFLDSSHGTQSLAMLVGFAGTVRVVPRDTVHVAGLGQGGSGTGTTCTQATEDQVIEALRVVAMAAEDKDILSLSFGSERFGMKLDMQVRQLVDRGIQVFAATGNERRLSLYPPASVPGAFAVGGIQNTGADDKYWDPDGEQGSNGEGPAVDFHGPAYQVEVPRDSSTQAMGQGKGTSLATPLVAGIAFYQILSSNLAGVSPPDLRDRVDAALRTTATVRPTQIVVPFTPTSPVLAPVQSVPRQILLTAAANDDRSTWLAGYRTTAGSGALLRVPTGTATDPRAPNASATNVVWGGGANAQCRAVAASTNFAAAGCWSTLEQGRLRLYSVDSENNVQETAAIALDGVPIAVAVDVEDPESTFAANARVRVALVQPLLSIGPTGNPSTTNEMKLGVARQDTNGTWVVGTVGLGSSPVGYLGQAALALNCPRGDNGDLPTDCDAFALIARANGSAVELWKLSFSSSLSQPVLGTPVLVAERVDTGPFSTCFIPGWAWSEGLSVVGLSVDNATNTGSTQTSRWSFAYNRIGTGYFGTQCGFDSFARVANNSSPIFDVTGPRGEAWSQFSWGATSRTGLALTSIWDPATAQFSNGLRSTIRTLHPRGAAPIPNANIRLLQHSSYGDDATALSSADGISWSIQRVQP